MDDDRIQALVFGEVAETYHEARPRYPDQLVSDVLAFGPVPPGGHALEVGAGTGIATAAFASAGLRITAIEPSEEMAALARRSLPSTVEVVLTKFEEWESDERFDLVYAAQAWHWVDPDVGFTRAHELLKPGGVLALMWNLEDPDQPDRLAGLDEVYEQFADELGQRATPARLRPPEELAADLVETSLFTPPERLTYPWSQIYSTEEFLRLQMTHSPKRMLPPDRRRELLDQIGGVIDAHGGAIEVRYTTNLFLARPV